jgi:polyisoprenoid-binding protein YceI
LYLLGLFSQPIDLNPSNTKASFSIDSTWHLINGKANNIEGKIWFDVPGDNSTSHVKVRLPVKYFDTESSRRDSRLREVMDVDHYPEVIFVGGPIGSNCPLEKIAEGQVCSTILPGEIQIRDVKKPIELKTTVTREDGKLNFHSKTELDWDTFNVEDPSILIAKLKKTVSISIDVNLPQDN